MDDYQQDGRELFDTWAPPESPWSAWAKPALFAQSRRGLEMAPWSASQIQANALLKKIAPATAQPRQTVVVDLPGMDTMQAAAELAQAGYRPVPLFNTTSGANAIVSVNDILAALAPVAEIIRGAGLDASAPPAFLLDARRLPWEGRSIAGINSGQFDNRWQVFPQDFPSAEFLKARGIGRILLCMARTERRPAANLDDVLLQAGLLDANGGGEGGMPWIAEDLSHVLLRWQEAGLPVFGALANSVGEGSCAAPLPLTVKKPPEYRLWWRRLLVMMKFRRNSAGGFGATVPQLGLRGGSG